MLFRRRSPLTPPSADAAFGHISQRHDDTTHDTLAPSAPFTKHTKFTKSHKENLCESLRRTATADAAALRAVAGV